jgi:hypothetical protein
MRTNRNIKPFHNGKDRRTGRPTGARRTAKANPTANNPDAEEVRLAWVAEKLEQRAKQAEGRSEGPCCSTETAKTAMNQRLLKGRRYASPLCQSERCPYGTLSRLCA